MRCCLQCCAVLWVNNSPPSLIHLTLPSTVHHQQVRPLEEAFAFPRFYSSLLQASDFEAKPSVMLIGGYSTGKTTFIKFLLGRDYPGAHIGPEPTTDR